jgi:predicted dehydrogenase
MSAANVKWLLVGTGDIVRKRVAAALTGAAGGTVTGICGGRERAEAIADEFGIDNVYDDLDAALAECDANAVYVATPVYRHRPEAIKAIEAGKHVLIEKPLGLDAGDAQLIVDAAKRASVKAGCAYYRRFFGRFGHLKQLVDEGALGRIVLVRTVCYSWFSPTTDDAKFWRVMKDRSGGGPLADMGSHMFDILIGLFGLPKTVFAHCGTLVQDYEVEDSSAIVMTLADGAQATASFGWNSKTWCHEFEVVGSEGRMQWRPADTGKVTMTMGRDIEELDLPNAENVHAPLVEDFNRAVAEDRDPLVPAAEAVKTNRLLDAIYRSAATGREVVP